MPSLFGISNSASAIIAEQILSGTAASITFSDIPQIYASLVLEVVARETDTAGGSSGFHIRFNGDTGNNYSDSSFYGLGYGMVLGYDTAANRGYVGQLSNDNAAANVPGFATIIIPGYAATTFIKGWNTCFNLAPNSTGLAGDTLMNVISGGYWNNNGAITSITLLPMTGKNFVAGSSFTLYGNYSSTTQAAVVAAGSGGISRARVVLG